MVARAPNRSPMDTPAQLPNTGCAGLSMTKPTRFQQKSITSRHRYLRRLGILCEEWQDRAVFFDAVYPAPKDHILKRPDKTKPIGPGNWVWSELNRHENRHANATHWQKNNPEKVKEFKLKRRYGISYEGFMTLKASQGGVCKLCGVDPTTDPTKKSGSLCVDHCHKTKKIRGLLCRTCNMALGKFKESIPTLQNAIEYLQEHET